MEQNPRLSAISDDFEDRLLTYSIQDQEQVQHLVNELTKTLDMCKDLQKLQIQSEGKSSSILSSLMLNLETVIFDTEKKKRNMEHNSSYRVNSTIDQSVWNRMLENLRLLREQILAMSEFQSSTSLIFDFLNLPIWRQRWRIYEIWMLVYLLNTFEELGFKIDISSRLHNGEWDLKYSRDKEPVGFLINEKIKLDVFYQLFVDGNDAGDMPDIALKIGDNFFLVIDPKHGQKYTQANLIEVGKRYLNSFKAHMTIIHNFYPMENADYIISENPLALVLSNIQPNTEATESLRYKVLSTIPESWLPRKESIVMLVDISGSVENVIDNITEALTDHCHNWSQLASEDSKIIFFSDIKQKEFMWSNYNDALVSFPDMLGGGTDLRKSLGIAIEQLEKTLNPSHLFLFTDGIDEIDDDALADKIKQSSFKVHIFEATDVTPKTNLEIFAQITNCQYKRI